jgi:hypothetical protein
MPTPVTVGSLWENPHFPGVVYEVIDTTEEDMYGYPYITIRNNGRVSAVDATQFREDFAPIEDEMAREEQTAFDRLMADDILPEPTGKDAGLVSSVTVETVGSHDVVRVWNRGGLAGMLTVCKGDGDALRQRLLGRS